VQKIFSSDLPIENAKDDALNRGAFAENLAKVMLNYTVPEGFVIGIYGKWGSGKTSVINMVLEKAKSMYEDDAQKPIVLRFNPWLYSEQQQLISQFFKQLSSAIKINRPKLEILFKHMNAYADILELARLIPLIGGSVADAGKLLKARAKAYNESQNNDLQRAKDAIITALLKEKIKLIVTIDDIDRLSSAEVALIFQLVKSLADFPYTIYLLSFDREVVIRALADVQRGDGAEYLEKVVQVPFELPIPTASDIHQVFLKKLDAIIADTLYGKWDNDYWSSLFHFGIKQYLRTIRDAVRYTNTFALKYSLLKDEINIIDLIGLTCIQVFEPEIYSRLPFHKEQLCGGLTYYTNHDQEVKKKVQTSYNAIIAGIPDNRAGKVKEILSHLFPKLSASINTYPNYSSYFDAKKALISGSIASPDCFERYFALSLESTAIPRQVMERLLYEATEAELVEGITEINLSRKTTQFLEYVDASFEQKRGMPEYSKRAEMIFACLALIGHELEDNKELALFSISLKQRLVYCARSSLQVIDKSCRHQIVYEVFIDSRVDLSILTALLRDFGRQHNRFTDRKSDEKDALLTLNEVLELEKAFSERVILGLKSGELIANDSFLHVIWLFEQIDEARAKEYTSNMITSDLALAFLVSSAVGRGVGAQKTVFTIWRVNKDDISKYVDINEAHERISTFVLGNEFDFLDSKRQENVAAFLISMDEKAEDISLDDGIVASDIKKKLEDIKAGV